ncbi:hypothetical protein LTS08_003789 [Lithohypha guttulata]|nr:hypothetical protein LTS08_003789 [Lithohypha guttulata]
MPTTRSASKKQASLDDFTEGSTLKPQPSRNKAAREEPKSTTSKAPSKENSSAKRKLDGDDKTPRPRSKKLKEEEPENTKQSHFEEHSTTELEKPIVINRSPVLQLWGASVASFLHPAESWETCLSIGGSIASLCAISKGRAIGKVEPKDTSDEAEKKREDRKRKSEDDLRELEVMGFPMHIKNGVVLVDGKQKPLNEGSLRSKFGGEGSLNAAKKVMQEALETWQNDKDELDKKAFHIYEKFRPNVASGSGGWGKKGELNLHEVRNVITK